MEIVRDWLHKSADATPLDWQAIGGGVNVVAALFMAWALFTVGGGIYTNVKVLAWIFKGLTMNVAVPTGKGIGWLALKCWPWKGTTFNRLTKAVLAEMKSPDAICDDQQILTRNFCYQFTDKKLLRSGKVGPEANLWSLLGSDSKGLDAIHAAALAALRRRREQTAREREEAVLKSLQSV